MEVKNFLLAIFGIMFFLLFCWFLLMTWKSKNFKKRVRLGEVGIKCKYWINETAFYGTVKSYDSKTDKVTIREELIPQFLENVEPSII